MKAKTILSAVFTAICLASCILDWDPAMYMTGLTVLMIIGSDDLKFYFRFFRKMTRKSGSMRSIRKEVVKA